MKYYLKLFLFLLFCLSMPSLKATHNRAGEITFKHVSGLTYEVYFVVYSDPASQASQRSTVEVCWGDEGECNQNTLTVLDTRTVTILNSKVQRNEWVERHTYNGSGSFKITLTDPARNAGVSNISNSVSVPLYLETTLRISPFQNVINNSPILLNYPIDEGCQDRLFIHNPGAVDPDGDSLAYEIDKSRTTGGVPADGFVFPPATVSISVDAVTGDLIWNNPAQLGSYNIAMRIKEFRDGVLIGSVMRDMQIDIELCDNQPPEILVKTEHCVTANELLIFGVDAFDPDVSSTKNQVTLTSTGLVYDFANSPATFIEPSASRQVNGTFAWIPDCEHIQSRPYNVLFKAVDNGFPNLSTYKTSYISVLAPAVKNFIASSEFNSVRLNWDTIDCDNADGFKIYRRFDSTGFVPDTCEVGVPESLGYELIANLNDVTQTTFLDSGTGNGLESGRTYCYLIISYHSDGSESYASNETCITIGKIKPILTKASVSFTDAVSGVVDLQWSTPDTIDDSIYPPPYRYVIQHELNGSFVAIDSIDGLLDTNYLHLNINTVNSANTYQVSLFSLGNRRSLLSNSSTASTPFLTGLGGDELINLSVNTNVPWRVDSTIVLKLNSVTNTYDSIAVIQGSTYTDSDNLENGTTYCYQFKQFGSYDLNTVKLPLVNFSQEICLEPTDLTPPCTPELSADYNCFEGELTLNWDVPTLTCPEFRDIAGFNLYTIDADSTVTLLSSVQDRSQRSIFYRIDPKIESLANCYSITAIDSAGNESSLSNFICLETCPVYELPNVFTPNGDSINDIFVPAPYRYVAKIDLTIFDRWGRKIFSTENPDINWSGEIEGTNELVSDGVFYYSCIVYEIKREGIVERELNGTITVINATIKGIRE